MTVVKLHGILAKKFSPTIKINIGRMSDIVHCIDCVKDGFREFLKRLSEKGQNYCIEKGENSEIHILPLLAGSGRVGMIIAAVILIVIAVVLTILFPPAGVAAFSAMLSMGAGLTGAAAVTMFIAGTLFYAGVQLAIQAALMKTPSQQKQENRSTGGGSIATQAQGKSYIFQNNPNSTTQGGQIPIGYGRFKTGSDLIAISVKNYSTNSSFDQESSLENLNYVNIYD